MKPRNEERWKARQDRLKGTIAAYAVLRFAQQAYRYNSA